MFWTTNLGLPGSTGLVPADRRPVELPQSKGRVPRRAARRA
jgi:hypothetical protein